MDNDPAREGKIDLVALSNLDRFAGPGVSRQTIQLFLEYAPGRLQECREGLKAGDASKTEIAAHSLKSMAGQLGAVRLQLACEKAEHAATQGDFKTLAPLIEEMKREFLEVKPWYEKKISEQG